MISGVLSTGSAAGSSGVGGTYGLGSQLSNRRSGPIVNSKASVIVGIVGNSVIQDSLPGPFMVQVQIG